MKIKSFLILLSLLCFSFPLFAEEDPAELVIFGPERFEVESSPAYFSKVFEVLEPSEAVVEIANGVPPWIHCPDPQRHRVTSGTVRINGRVVIGPGRLNALFPQAAERIFLPPGPKHLDIKLEGPPDSFIILTIGKVPPPDFTEGRLVLSFVQAAEHGTATLFLRNNSPEFGKRFRILLFRPDGHLAFITEPHVLPPNGAFVAPLASPPEIEEPWRGGSVEVLWLGRARAPLTGYALQHLTAGGTVLIPTTDLTPPPPPPEPEPPEPPPEE